MLFLQLDKGMFNFEVKYLEGKSSLGVRSEWEKKL